MITSILYVVAALIGASMLSKKTDRRALSFILIFWIFTQPILNSILLIHTPGLGFDFQPNRILLLVLLPYLIVAGKASGNIKKPPFEKYLYLYLLIVTISLFFNLDVIRKQNLVVVPLEVFTYIILYTVVKKHATPSFYESIINAIIVMAVLSAVISFYQVIINSNFLKTCPPRIAFGNVVRASGVFQSEYELGYFQILAIMVAVVKYKGSAWKLPLIGLFIASLLTTFHRLDLLILFACYGTYIMFFGKLGQKVASYGLLTVALLIGLTSYTLLRAT